MQLSPDILDHAKGAPPLSAQLADHVRQLIVSRDLKPGAEIPGELKIAGDVGLSRTAVRDALKQLVGEGLLERRAGAMTRVPLVPSVRRIDIGQYHRMFQLHAEGHKTPDTAFVAEHGADWERYTINPCEVTQEDATAQDAHYLHVEEGSKILRRRFVQRIDGKPLQIKRSAMPWRLGGLTPLADASRYPWPGGAPAELDSIGMKPDWFTYEVAPRMPNRMERELLEMRVTGPVFDIVRVLLRNGDPVEANRVIAPCAGNTLYIEGPLP